MNDIMISTERKYSATVIPNVFIDRYLASANGAYVKIYLYLLRCLTGSEMQFSVSSAADFFDETESDIIRALKYWDKNNVIRLDRDGSDITGITLLDLTADCIQPVSRSSKSNSTVISINSIRQESVKVQEPAQVQELLSDNEPEIMRIPSLSQDDINNALNTSEVSFMTHAVEMYLERPLTTEDQNLIVFLYKHLNFSRDLILHLYEVCISRNKKNISYIQTVALNWYENGITSVEEADRHSVIYSAYFNAVNKAFNLGRLPGDKEQQYIRSWEDMGFSPEMVKEACDRTLIKCNKPSFAYADKILTSWNAENIKTPEALSSKDNVSKTARQIKSASKPSRPVSKSAEKYLNRYSQREYSAEDKLEIERQMLERSLGITIKREG